MRVGFILLDKKRPRVLTPALSAAAERHGFSLLALDPHADPQQWAAQGVDVIVHKVPEDHGLDARLLALQAAHPQLLLLDPPGAVRALQHREAMLAPLAGQPLLLHQSANACSQQQQQQQQLESCCISVPAQVTLLPGSTPQQAAAQLAAAGIGLPALLKPLSSMPSDSAAVGTAAAASGGNAGSQASNPTAAAAAAAAAKAAVADGHALGVLLEERGLRQLLDGGVPELAPPVVVQQFVPHGEALYKLYVIGPHIVLTRRSTLTLQHIQQAAAAAAATAAADGSGTDGSGTDAGRPAVVLLQRQLAAHLRQQLQLSLFNVDIIAPKQQQQQQQQQQQPGPDDLTGPTSISSVGGNSSSSSSSSCRRFLVVDVNFFPGFDKVPGAEQLFADFLASLRPSIPV